ncbi:MAG: sterol desaturase family protein [Betaproteobacteria bacterium]|nr:sterol desaturase family protein [Betaproteobacteria bacterium]
MTGAQVIVLATPVFLGLIATEFAVGLARGRNTYRLNDALNSIGLGVMSQVTGVFGKLLRIGVYTLAFEHVALLRLPADAPWVWLFALVFYDFCYYWLHRAGHRVAVLWAAHVVHHQSEDYNLSTALRQPSSYFLFSWIFYLPMALAGVPPLVFATVALIDLLYQFWVHTQQVGRLGWFDRWFCSPSNHRVHHAVNDKYLDKNYGGILIVWDRLFGSFVEEDDAEPCVYGTRSPLRSWNPVWANLQVYRDLVLDSWRARSWADKLRVWLKPPGWRPADVAARWPKPAFDIAAVRRYDPPVSPAASVAAAALFLAVLGGTSAFLWLAHELSLAQQAAAVLALVAALWLIGALTQPRREHGKEPRLATPR